MAKRVPVPGGRYFLVKRLGDGNFGEVWLADDDHEGDRVAIKFLDPAAAIDAVLAETKVQARLREHDRVVGIRNVGLGPPRAHIVMEYVPGGSAEKRLERGEVTLVEAVRWVRDALDGLAHTHSLGILHRDLRPANLLVDAAGRALLSDFGLAEDTVRNLLANAAMYLPNAAPELLQGGPSSAATDLWAMGCTLYRLIAGESPFDTQQDTLNGSYEPMHHVDPQVPLRLSRVVDRALSVDPTARYATAAEMRGDLIDCGVMHSFERVDTPGTMECWVADTAQGRVEVVIRESRGRFEVLVRLDRGAGPRKRTSTPGLTVSQARQKARGHMVHVVQGGGV